MVCICRIFPELKSIIGGQPFLFFASSSILYSLLFLNVRYAFKKCLVLLAFFEGPEESTVNKEPVLEADRFLILPHLRGNRRVFFFLVSSSPLAASDLGVLLSLTFLSHPCQYLKGARYF